MADPTSQVQIGKTNLHVTRMGFGCAPIGNLLTEVSEEAAQEAIAAAFKAGIRYIDTAPFYGYGLSEQRVGRALKGWNRDDFVVSTKVGRLIRPGQRTGNELFGEGQSFYVANPEKCAVFDYSYDGVMRSLEDSLKRLDMDRVDILHIHDPDEHFEDAASGAYKALDRLRSDGTISAVSAGMNQWEMLERFMDNGRFDCFLLAGRYSLLDQTALASFLPRCERENVSVILGGVFNSGLLANPQRGATFNYVPAPDDLVERALQIKAVCERHGVDLKAAALQFPLAHKAIASILSGVRSASEWKQNMSLFEAPIPDALWDELRAEGLLAENVPTPSNNTNPQVHT